MLILAVLDSKEGKIAMCVLVTLLVALSQRK